MDQSKQNAPPPPPLEPPTSELQIGRGSIVPWILLVLLVAGVAALLVSGVLMFRAPRNSALERERFLRALAERNVDFQEYLDREHIKTNWRVFAKQIDDYAQRVEKIDATVQSLEKEFVRLEKSDAGRGIAAQPKFFEGYASLRQDVREITPATMSAAREGIKSYRDLCDEVLNDRTIHIHYDAENEKKSREFFDDIRQTGDKVAAFQTTLDHIVRETKQGPRSEQLLDEVLTRYYETKHLQFFRTITDQFEKEHQASEERIRNASLDAQRELLATEQRLRLGFVDSQTRKVRSIYEEAVTKVVAENERNARLVKFNEQFSKIRPFLSPFLTPGNMHLDNRQNWKQGRLAPLSLAAIKAHPSFASTAPKAATAWGIFFSGEKSRNDRPRGKFPQTISDNQEDFIRVRSFLAEFGDLLVTQGLLEP